MNEPLNGGENPAGEETPESPGRPGDKAKAKPNRARRTPPKNSWVVTVVAIFILGAWAVFFFLGLALFQWTGAAASAFQQQLVLFSMAFLAIIVVFALFASSEAVASAGLFGWKLWVVGPVGAGAVVYLTLWMTAPSLAHRTVQIYLSYRGTGDELAPKRIGQFVIHYRRPTGPGNAAGQNGVAVAQDIARTDKEMLVDRVDCFGFIPAKQQAGEAPPWKYPIVFTGDTGETTIEMVKIKPAEDLKPQPKVVLELIKKQGLKEEQIRQATGIDKHHVTLRIRNAADRPIDFYACDCVAALDGVLDLAGGGAWTLWKNSGHIQPDEEKTWPNFDKFQKPSGWFALFVRHDDYETNRVIQKPLGVYNLFRVREPKLVIERDWGAPGVEFRINESQSKLGE